MPVYELFCLARPQISKDSLAKVICTASKSVFGNGGVLTDVHSYGSRELAYPIRKAGGKYTEVCDRRLSSYFVYAMALLCRLLLAARCDDSNLLQATMWQMNFLVRPSALPEINRNLQIDEDVLRWLVMKKRQHPAKPNTHSVAKAAQRLLDDYGVHHVDSAMQHVAPH